MKDLTYLKTLINAQRNLSQNHFKQVFTDGMVDHYWSKFKDVYQHNLLAFLNYLSPQQEDFDDLLEFIDSDEFNPNHMDSLSCIDCHHVMLEPQAKIERM